MKFMNLTKWNSQGYQDEMNPQGGNGDGGQPAQQEQTAPQQQPAPAPQQQGIDYDLLAQAMVRAQASQQQPPATQPSYQDHVNAEKDKQTAQEQQKQIESAIKFNSSIADTLASKSDLFPERTKTLLAKQYDSETAKADTVQKFASRDFFSNPKNLELLQDSEKLIVQQNLINEHGDINMTGAEAWGYVERALYIHDLKADADKKSNFYSGNDKQELPENIKAFHDRVYPKGVVSSN